MMAGLRFVLCATAVAVANAGTCPPVEPQGDALALFQTSAQRLERDTVDKAAPAKDEAHAQKTSNYSGIKVSATSANVTHKAHHRVKTTEPDAKTSGLPEVATVLSNSHRVFTEMTSQMTALEARLAEVQQQGALAVSKQKVQYEAKLKTQRAESHATALVNSGIAAEVEELRTSNGKLRQTADKVAVATNKLRSTVQEMQGNITTAMEFIDKTLDTSTSLLNNATELTVLAELAEHDEAQAHASAHEKRLISIGMLQNSAGDAMQPKDLFQSLLSSFDDLSKEQNESETALKAAYEHEMQVGADKQKKLIEEQVRLNVTKQEQKELKERLTVAVTHLKKVHEQLLQRSHSLHLFLERFGEHAVPKVQSSLALLQELNATSTAKSSNASRHAVKSKANKSGLPEVSSVLENSHRVFTTMTTQMAALEARLAEVQQKGAEAVSRQKAQYEAKLKIQRADAHAVELANAGIATETAKLEKSNANLRSKAAKLTQASNKLRATIHDIQGNITTAAEFIDKTLDASTTMLENSSELSVLTELSEKDEVQNKALAHQNRLSSIGQVSMLQQLEVEKMQPNDMLQSLLSSFDDLSKEQNVSETALKEAFEKQYQDGSDRHTVLLAEQAKLNITRDEQKSLHVKLNVAVTHLETVQAELLQRSQSLQLFMRRFADQSVPASTQSK